MPKPNDPAGKLSDDSGWRAKVSWLDVAAAIAAVQDYPRGVHQPLAFLAALRASIARRVFQERERRRDSGHFARPPGKRREIVEQFRRDKDAGKVENMEGWAKQHFIEGRTLRNWLKEFPPDS